MSESVEICYFRRRIQCFCLCSYGADHVPYRGDVVNSAVLRECGEGIELSDSRSSHHFQGERESQQTTQVGEHGVPGHGRGCLIRDSV